jgi:glycosyltransferase involved in cell wall biosynthesis
MNIWLIYPYGSLPGEGFRPDRPNMVAEALSNFGHTVTWWGSNFEHRTKKFRSDDWLEIEVSPLNKTILVPTSGYEKNISLDRIKSENEYASKIYKHWKDESCPDVIIMGDPSLFISKSIKKIVKESNCLLVLDIGDLWPELFHIILPKYLEYFGKIIFAPLYFRRKKLYRNADAIIGFTQNYLELARKIAPKLPKNQTETVYFGMNVTEQRSENELTDNSILKKFELYKKEDEVFVIYASTLGNNYDLKTLLEVGKIIENKNYKVKILIAGAGPLSQYVQNYIIENKLSKLIYLGNPTPKEMNSIYSVCDIGLSMYLNSSTVSMPIKAFHYFCYGLPIINSLIGDVSSFITKYNAGINYHAEDVNSFINALLELSSNAEKRKTMALNSFELASVFDIRNQYSNYVKFIEKIWETKKK